MYDQANDSVFQLKVRTRSARSESSGSDTDSDCMVLVYHTTLLLAYIYMPKLASEMSESIPKKTSSGSGPYDVLCHLEACPLLLSDTHSGTNSRPLIRSKAQVIPFKKGSSPAKVGVESKAKPLALESSSSSGLDGESDTSSDSESNESNNDKVTSGSTLRGTETEEITVAVSPKSESEGGCSLWLSISRQQ